MNQHKAIFRAVQNQEPVPAPGLYMAVINRVQYERQKVAKRRFSLCALATFVSSVFLAYAVVLFAGEWKEAGSAHFIGLIFSDGTVLAAYWKEFLLSVAESLPVLGLTAVALGLLAFLSSLAAAGRGYARLKSARSVSLA